MDPRREISELLGGLKAIVSVWAETGFAPPVHRPFESPSALPAKTSENHSRKFLSPSQALELIREEAHNCRRCRLHEGRRNVVFGEGNPKARLVFVGEGPGREEDESGRPFVGEAGALLTRIIENGMGLKREDVYICNVVKCRPPNNRVPERDEMIACLPFLKRQLGAVRPQVICCLGQTAARALISPDFKVGAGRGKWYSYEALPVMVTYHPGYLLRNPKDKAIVWEDIKQVMARLGLSGGNRGRQ